MMLVEMGLLESVVILFFLFFFGGRCCGVGWFRLIVFLIWIDDVFDVVMFEKFVDYFFNFGKVIFFF